MRDYVFTCDWCSISTRCCFCGWDNRRGNMAAQTESKTSSSKTLKELEAEITCLVCQNHYSDAKLLPCMHYYCRQCVEKLSKCAVGKSFPCPECREDTFLPSDGVAGLKSAFFVERMKDLFAKMSTEEGTTETTPCEVCKGRATLFCRDCALFYCSSKCLTDCKEHHVIHLEKGAASGTSVDPYPICQEHGDHVTVYCFTCETAVCRDCIVSGHSGHTFNALKTCALEKRRKICSSLIPLHRTQSDILDAQKKVNETEKEIERQSVAITQSIRETFGELKSILEQSEVELESLAMAFVKEKKDALGEQKKELQVAGAEIESLVNFAESIIENVSDKEMMERFSGLRNQVLEELKRHSQMKIEPVTTADIVCDLPPLSIIPDNMGSISCQPQSSDAHEIPIALPSTTITTEFFRPVVLQASDVCDVGKRSKMTLQICLHQKLTVFDLHPKVDSSSTVTPKVTAKGNGVFEISYTPIVRGRHDLIVKVDGVNICDSPFRIFANIHPGRLGPPTLTMDGLVQPMAITLDHNQQLVVAEYGKSRLVVLSREGALLRSVKPDYSHFRAPRGVAIGPEGTFFVTCNDREDPCCLVKLDYFGHTLKALQLNDPFGVKVIGGRLYVCVKGKVEIFDVINCSRVGRLTADQLTKPYDVAAGRNCLYVVNNSKNGSIAKFSFDGQFKGLFQQGLSSPRYICVNAAGFVFVTLGRVPPYMLVFSEAGDLVASFGMERDWLRNSSSMAVDEDGFIYACAGGTVVVF